jgi:hypothetical protein
MTDEPIHLTYEPEPPNLVQSAGALPPEASGTGG